MGYIREPENVDLVVGPSTLTEKDIQFISDAIAKYRKSGKHPANVGEMLQDANFRKSTVASSSRKKAAKV
jgi:hypothetical protein